jgi:hypothetical protein
MAFLVKKTPLKVGQTIYSLLEKLCKQEASLGLWETRAVNKLLWLVSLHQHLSHANS